jgi:hypothetical protein
MGAEQRLAELLGKDVPISTLNGAPIAEDDVATTDVGSQIVIDVLTNDDDPDGDDLIVAAVTSPADGQAIANADGTVTYTPNAGFSGTDSFTYTLRDAGGASDIATVSIDVVAKTTEPEPDPEPTPDLGYRKLGAHEFSGAGRDVIVVEHSAALELSSGTISFTFNADTVAGHRGLLSKDAKAYVGGGNHFASYIDDGTLHVRFQDENSDQSFRVPGIRADRDYAFEATFGNGEVAVRLDGALVGAADFDMDWRDNVQDMQIGANGWGSASGAPDFDHIFDGTISDVLIL